MDVKVQIDSPEEQRQDGDGVRRFASQPPNVNRMEEDRYPDPHNQPEAEESTPLLHRHSYDVEDRDASRSTHPRRYWWTIVAIAVLLIITVNIIIFAFVVPSAAQTYATQATTYSVQDIKIEEYTDSGVIADVQVNITTDASRVHSNGIRNLGLFATGLFKHVYTKPCTVSVLLPQYAGTRVALVTLPALAVDVRNLHVNLINIVSNVTITDHALAVQLAGDVLAGRRKEVHAVGETDVDIKAGIIPLGRHHVEQEVIIKGNAPKLPAFTVNQLDIVDRPGQGTAMTTSLDFVNPYRVTLDVPSMAWKVKVPGCNSVDLIRVADVETGPISLQAGSNVTLVISSLISSLPQGLVDPCGDEAPSPLEALFQALLTSMQNATIFISGSSQTSSLPKWLPDILSSLTIPVPLPSIDTNATDLISSIRCSEMKVTFPSPWAPPGTPNAQPKISGVIEAVIRPPEGAKEVDINVTAVRADIYLSDAGDKFGRVLVPEWSPTSTEHKGMIHVIARVAEVPIEVLDPAAFQRVMSKVLRGDGAVEIGVEGTVDGQVSVLIGDFAIRGIPVKGIVDVEGIRPFDDLKTALVGDINVVSTTKGSITLQSTVEVTNPTTYEAFVPYLNLHLLYQGHLIGNATAINASVTKGVNQISGLVTYAPATAADIPFGQEFLGEYLSGRNPNVTALFHNNSIEGYPGLSLALSGLNITFPVPSMSHKPKESDNPKRPSLFIRSTTIHVLSRTAQFELFNPLYNSEITINSIAANATYDDEIVGTIMEPEFNFRVAPGSEGHTTTDRIPVEVASVGYDVIRRALGGELVVDAVAEVVATIGKWRGRVRYEGQGLGAKVRL